MPYESKPMKKQWIEVDGKMTPIILPQIWSHEKQDWVVTSEQNPLPTQLTGSNVELEVYKGVDLSRTIGASFNKSDGANKAVIEYVIEKKDDNPDGRIFITSLNRLSGSRHDSIEIYSGGIYESGRILFFWGFNNIDDYKLSDNILGIITSPIPPLNTFAHVIAVGDGGVFDVTTNVSYFI